MKGYLITFEGLEAAGKSTQVIRLQRMLEARRIKVITTREPGGTPVAEKIRSFLLSGTTKHSGIGESVLFSIARTSHVYRCIRPALKKGRWVICDRFVDTTRAYQGGGRAIPSWWIELLIRLTTFCIKPDVTIILDIPPEHIRARVRQRGKTNRFDNERIEFFHRARNAYLLLAQAEPDRVHLLNAMLPPDEVGRQVALLIKPLLER